ncbi:hypothetical protein [Xanthomonas sp. SS]|uniref:hypothetical protein n=1 Tax=Xanthomonas sp. SS TaxID=2724122 RepID=UPI00163AE2C3|nr:hypothetical protein [Xanthomonas sp. SS]
MEDSQGNCRRQRCCDETRRRRIEQSDQRREVRQQRRCVPSIAQARTAPMSERARSHPLFGARSGWLAQFDGRKAAGDARQTAGTERMRARPSTCQKTWLRHCRTRLCATGISSGRTPAWTSSSIKACDASNTRPWSSFAEHDAHIDSHALR